jgi:hypothetical protein
MNANESIALRRATRADQSTIARLASLDSAPGGEVLIAEMGGEPIAAVAIAGGMTRPAADLAELLTMRAAHVRLHIASPGRQPAELRFAT